SSQEMLKIKGSLDKQQKWNRPVPRWIHIKAGSEIRLNSKRRRTRLRLKAE
uniref:Ribosomal protein L39 n=1 Tax=Podarcis muralis TaxID=64176 RepID=A0A670JR52_PODMU